jgi:hypothetical protein
MLALLATSIISGTQGQTVTGSSEKNMDIRVESRIYYGWTIDHHVEMTLYQRHYPAYEISILKATKGHSLWEVKYNYPLVGISYWYSNLGNTKPYGAVHAVFPYLDFPLLRTNQHNLYFRMGAGIGYFTKKYHRYDNFENLAIGSHINGAVNFILEGRFRLWRKIHVSGGLSWMHFSNGAIKLPNYGLNMPGVNFAVSYRLSDEDSGQAGKPELFEYSFEKEDKGSFYLDLNIGAGIKDLESMPGKGNQYGVAAIIGNFMFPVSYKSRFGAGFDISYDGTDEKYLEREGTYPENRINLVKTGVTAGYEIIVSRVSVMLNVGVTLTGLYNSGTIYEKVGIRVDLGKNLLASLALKAYYGKADYVTLGIGYRLKVKYRKSK